MKKKDKNVVADERQKLTPAERILVTHDCQIWLIKNNKVMKILNRNEVKCWWSLRENLRSRWRKEKDCSS